MKLKIRIDKGRYDDYIIESNHIPRYKEFIDIDNHRFVVEHVAYIVDDILQKEITDVIIYVAEIY